MKVLHIQTGLPTSGNAIFRLHQALLGEGYDSSLLMLTSSRPVDGFVNTISDPFKNFRVVANQKIESYLLRNKIKGSYAFSYPKLGYDLTKNRLLLDADISVLHWSIGGLLTIDGYRKIAKLGKPVLFFMHDMWSITGGCHHSFDCAQYEDHCGNCAMFINPKLKDITYQQFEKKRKLYSEFDNIFFASPSTWLSNCIKKAALTHNKETFHLPNLINQNVFRPFAKGTAKGILNISTKKIVITFGAKSGAESRFKGWSYMKEALNLLRDRNPEVEYLALVFGSEYDQKIVDGVPFETKFTGYLFDDYALNIVYNATDVFVTPTLADNFPSTVLESMSCNTPVVAFNVGGLSDMIVHKENGYLARYLDVNDLTEGIEFCINNGIKGFLKKELNPAIVLEKYKSAFDRMIKLK